MNRLQKKCVLVSAGLHLLLVGILFIGPAFLSSKTTADALPPIDFVPWKTVDAMVTGGGNPNAQATPPALKPAPVTQPAPMPPPVATPVPPPVMVPTPPPMLKRILQKLAPEPEPEKPKIELPKTKEPDPDSFETKVESKPKRPQISTELVTRKDSRKEAKAREEKAREEKAREQAREQSRAEAQQLADARRRIVERFGQAAEQIGSGLSSSTTVEIRGPGGGGIPYANFALAVQSAYDKAWLLPNGVSDSEATAVVSVTIARDGKVVASRIERSSGNRAVDRSVQAALDKVRYAAPLPDDAHETERTVTINFNVKAKRGLA